MEVVSASHAANHSPALLPILYRLKYLSIQNTAIASLHLGYLVLGRVGEIEAVFGEFSKGQQSKVKSYDETMSLLEALPQDWPDYLADTEIVVATAYYGKETELLLSSINTLYERRKLHKHTTFNPHTWSPYDFHTLTMLPKDTGVVGAKTASSVPKKQSPVPAPRYVVYNKLLA